VSPEESRRKPLGRGLSALLGDRPVETGSPPRPGRTLPVAEIRPNRVQPRRDFDKTELDELARSIRTHGLLQPVLVRRDDRGGYELVAGERRWRAAQAAGLHDIPAVVRDVTDGEALALALIENIQRQDLNPIEEALAYRRLQDEFGHTQEAVADAVGKSRPHVTNLLRLLDLPEGVQVMVASGTLSAGHARAMLGVPATALEGFAQEVVRRGLSVRQTENEANALKRTAPAAAAKVRAGKDADTRALERELTEQLGLKVTIAHAGGGQAGSLTIQYRTLDQLDDLLARLGRGK
jgi:ParB family chromosome partitioning protein